MFMPVATQASLKGLTPEQLEDTGCRLCLNNTYHLGLKPGQDVLAAVGGAHKLQGWRHNILTDSGGYVHVHHPMLCLPPTPLFSFLCSCFPTPCPSCAHLPAL